MIFTIGPIFFISSTIQSIVGFGFGLVSLPLLLLVGIPLTDSIYLIVLNSFIQTLQLSFHLREHIDFKMLIHHSLIRILFIPLGVYSLTKLSNLPLSQIKQTVSMVIISTILIQSFRSIKINIANNILCFIALAASGFMAGFIAIGGPPLVLWVHAQQWNPLKTKAYLAAIFTLTIPILLIFFSSNFPGRLLPLAKTTLFLIPFVLLGTKAGLIIGSFVPKKLFRKITIALLIIMSLKIFFE